MSSVLTRFAAAYVPLAGLSLLHFIWQGALIALALKLILKGCRRSEQRYLWAMAALAVMAVTPVVSFIWLSDAARHGREGLDLFLERAGAGLPWFDDWRAWIVGAWVAGVALLVMRAVVALSGLAALKARGEAVGEALAKRLDRLAKGMAPGWSVRFQLSADIDSPAVIGWFKPVILLPLAAMAHTSPEALEAVVLHELAHVRRWDSIANAFQLVVERLLFYHPAVWWASRIARDERENCCDDLAVAMTGDPAGYVRALATMAQKRLRGEFALGASGGALLERARRQLAPELASGQLSPAWAMAAAAMLAVTALTSSWIGGGQTVQTLMSLTTPVRQLSRALTSAPSGMPSPVKHPIKSEKSSIPARDRQDQAVPVTPGLAMPTPAVAVMSMMAASPPEAQVPPSDSTTATSPDSDGFDRAGRIYQQIAMMRSADQAYDEADSRVKDSEEALEKTLKQVASLANALIYSQPDQLNSTFLSDRNSVIPMRSRGERPINPAALPVGSARKQVDQAKLVAYLDAQPIGRLAEDQENQLVQAQAELAAAAEAQQAAHDQLAELTRQ